MGSADFLTVDVFDRPPGGRLLWRRRANRELKCGIWGLRAATVNHANNGTYSIAPRLVPGGCALVAAWDSPEAAEAAFRGPLRPLIDGAGRFSLDGEMVRVRVSEEGTAGTAGRPVPRERSRWRRTSRWWRSSTESSAGVIW